MSAIASFTKLPKSSIDALRTAASPQDFTRQHGVDVANYRWSGYVIAAVIPYLAEKHGIDLSSELTDLGSFLSEKGQSSFFPLTLKDKEMYLHRLEREFPELELRDYYNGFFESDEPDIGAAMKDGILAIKQALGAIDEESFVLLHIG